MTSNDFPWERKFGILSNIEELDKYAEEQGVTVPENVSKLCGTADKLGIRLITRLNNESAKVLGCEEARDARNVLLKAEMEMPLYNELKTIFLKCKVRGSNEPLYVMAHFRANRLIDIKKLKSALNEHGYLIKDNRFVTDNELEQFGGAGCGQMTPLTILALRGIENKFSKEVVQVFDSDLMKRYSAKNTMVTNALDLSWMIEFNIEILTNAFQSKFKNIITGKSIVIGGPSQALQKLDEFISREIGFIESSNEGFQERIKKHTKKRIISLEEEVYSRRGGEVVISSTPIGYAGIFSNPTQVIISNPILDLSKSLDKLWFSEVLPVMVEELIKLYESDIDTLVVDCNILSGLADSIFSKEENLIQKAVKDWLNRTKSDLSLSDIKNQVKLIPKGMAIRKHFIEITGNKSKTQKILVLGGSQVSGERWSIYRKYLSDLQNIKLDILSHKDETDDAFLTDEAMYRVCDHHYEEANMLLFQVLYKNFKDNKWDYIAIASTSLVTLFERQNNKILDSEQIVAFVPELKKVFPELTVGAAKEFANKINKIPTINSSEVYAEFIANELIK